MRAMQCKHTLGAMNSSTTDFVVRAGAPQLFVVSGQVFAGHLDTDALAAAALGNTLWSLM